MEHLAQTVPGIVDRQARSGYIESEFYYSTYLLKTKIQNNIVSHEESLNSELAWTFVRYTLPVQSM